MTSDKPKDKPVEPARKPYQPPRLEVFGDLRATTQAVSPMGMGDGGMAGATKT